MEWRSVLPIASAVVMLGSAKVPAFAAEFVSIRPLKLVIVDKLASSSSAKAVFMAKDPRITKGSGTDPAAIDALLTLYYNYGTGDFLMPAGPGWLVNTTTVAKYENKSAPSGGATKVSVIKPGKLLKNVARSLGDMPMDISSPPGGILHTEYSIRNGEEQIYLCGEFPSSACSHKSIAGGTGWKVLCKNGFEAMCRKDPCWWTPCGAFVD